MHELKFRQVINAGEITHGYDPWTWDRACAQSLVVQMALEPSHRMRLSLSRLTLYEVTIDIAGTASRPDEILKAPLRSFNRDEERAVSQNARSCALISTQFSKP